jgi:hypothetical protein
MTAHYETKTWGDKRTYELIEGGNSAGTGFNVSALVKVTEKRPENWRFLFFARVTNAVTLAGWTLDIFFDLTLGLGRDTVQIPSFEHYVLASATYTIGDLIWSTTVEGPKRSAAEAVGLNTVDHLVFEHCFATPRFVTEANPGDLLVVEVGAFWSPNVHVPLSQLVPEPAETREDHVRELFAGEGSDENLLDIANGEHVDDMSPIDARIPIPMRRFHG